MSKNLELKAHVDSISSAVQKTISLKARAKGILHQKDIYYSIANGRLKLRIINNRNAELIFYKRPNKKGSRYSNYIIMRVNDSKQIDIFCTMAFGKKAVVIKKRHLFIYKNARIHIDDVQELGSFIEFEVIVDRGKRQAQKLLNSLIEVFSIEKGSIVACSYADLILRNKRRKKNV